MEIKVDVGPWMQEVAEREIRSRRLFWAAIVVMAMSLAPTVYFGFVLGWHHKPYADREVEYPKLHWVIIGGESGHGYRPMPAEWAQSPIDRCAAAGGRHVHETDGGQEADPARDDGPAVPGRHNGKLKETEMDDDRHGFHRAITGQAATRGQLVAGGILVVAWFLMDLVQWLDWLWSKL